MKGKVHEETHAVRVAGVAMVYTLERKSVRNINLRIRPDASIYVSAPHRVPLAEIERFIISKGSFIMDALERIQSSHAERSLYDDGEDAYYLGEKLTVRLSMGPETHIKREGDYLFLQIPDPENVSARVDVVKRWYAGEAEQIFMNVVREVYEEFRCTYHVPFPHVTIRQMKSRWGSCRPALGKITLNLLLVTAPYDELRYVVVHEFAHFIEPNHSQDFWRIVAGFEPEYRLRRQQLRSLPTKW
ncbi:PF01863 family protein [Mogibacterium timidum ATCC 33093]|uniref:PF01863 family protein n=1 Tax=Mogibacterium timidum ATCC 33093 TaxID=1401079 RepID=X8IRX1_9FIRM|nr:PF01863 family protein [Mogibacterium timidum ATCC 33093]